MATWLYRFLKDDGGQDLVEYAYLAAFVGLSGIVIWNEIVDLLAVHYVSANTDVQNLWVPPNP